MDLGGGVGDAWKYWRMSENRGHPGSCALKRCRMSRRGTLGRALLVTGGVIDVAPVVATVARIIADVVMTSL
jgi:hypothetical protein